MKTNFKSFLIYYFLFLFSSLTIFSSGVIDSTDGFQYLAVARNIYYSGEPTAPIYEYDTRKNVHMSTYEGEYGKTYSLTGLGYSLAYLPAVAITDIVYKIYGVSPPIHFPLENDWVIFLTASFTNAFFGAVLGLILLVYFILIGLDKRQALFMSLVSIFATNLFVYTKHSMPHMMFITFMMLSFLLLKLYSLNKKKYLLILAGVSYGILSITYNQTFILPFIPLVVYYLLLIKPKLSISHFKFLTKDVLYATLGFLPLAMVYLWFEGLRARGDLNAISPVFYTSYVNHLSVFPLSVVIEGMYGQLFSPGRSFFIYTPLLVIPLIFWTKIKRSLSPELAVFILLSVIYIVFYSMQYTIGRPDQGLAAIWHGESSWGPRYLTPLIPLGMLIVGHIYVNLSKKALYFIFYPLIVVGVYVQLLGVIMPYQIKFHDLEQKFYINSTEYTNFVYSNLLPRYTPIFMMSKKLINLAQSFPKTFDRSSYNVRFYDGIDFSFPVGRERWRVIDGKGYINFDNVENSPVKKISLGLINHPIEEASYSAGIQISLNNNLLTEKPEVIFPSERKLIDLDIPNEYLKPKNLLMIETKFKSLEDDSFLSETDKYVNDPGLYTNKNKTPEKHVSQILGMISFSINENEINKESIDFPYISSLGSSMTGIKYNNYGGADSDPWKSWHIHTQMFERLPDFWWIRNLYYWDIPKNWTIVLFSLSLLICITSLVKLKRYL